MKTGVGIRRVLRASIVASAASAALLLGTATASAGTLDQQQTSFGALSSGSITGNPMGPESLAQTFTAGITGRLDQVDLVLSKFFPPTDPLTLEIRDVAGGTPGNTVLGSASIPISAIPADPNAAFVSATFGAPAAVTAGTQYALVAWTTETTGNFGWSFQQTTNPYPGGVGLNIGASPPSGAWNMPPGDDFAFKTYVVPSPPAQPVPSKKKCKKHKKKHKSGAQVAKKKCKKKKHHHH
jgi:hypothetical protein